MNNTDELLKSINTFVTTNGQILAHFGAKVAVMSRLLEVTRVVHSGTCLHPGFGMNTGIGVHAFILPEMSKPEFPEEVTRR